MTTVTGQFSIDQAKLKLEILSMAFHTMEFERLEKGMPIWRRINTFNVGFAAIDKFFHLFR